MKTLVSWVERKSGEGSIIGTFGESMGGSICLMHGAIDERVDFVISDSAYDGIEDRFKHRLKEEFGLRPFPVLYLASLFNRLLSGGFYSDVSSKEAASMIRVPVMIIHGKEDSDIPASEGEEIYEALGGTKRLYLAEGAGHGEAIKADERRYYMEIKTFLNENDII